MIKTEINLYRAFQEPAPANAFLPWKQFVFFNLVLIAIMLLVFLASIIQYLYAAHDNTKILATYNTLNAEYIVLKEKFPPEFFSTGVSQTETQLRDQLEIQEKIIHSVVNATPFSADLAILSKIITPNVWLTEIMIDKGGHDITLQGKSLTTSDLKLFVKNIFNEKFFSEYTLSINDIENTEKIVSDQTIHFQLTLVKHNQ